MMQPSNLLELYQNFTMTHNYYSLLLFYYDYRSILVQIYIYYSFIIRRWFLCYEWMILLSRFCSQ